MTKPNRTRLSLSALEDRAVPAAFDLVIDGDQATANVTVDNSVTTQRTFIASATGAVLAVGDIEDALNAGLDVVVTTGEDIGNTESGNITWNWDSVEDDLDYNVTATRQLRFEVGATGVTGAIQSNGGVSMNFNDNVDLEFDTTLQPTNGSIDLLDNFTISNARSVSLNAGTASLTIDSNSVLPIAQSGDINITASVFTPLSQFELRSGAGSVTVASPIDLVNTGISIVGGANGVVTLNGAVDGANTLVLGAGVVSIGDNIGGNVALTEVVFNAGEVDFGASTIDAATITVGNNDSNDGAVWFGAGTGTVTGNLSVLFDGNIAPGGIGTVGTLSVVGDVTFAGGDYAIDVGAVADVLAITGDLTVVSGNLGDETGTGSLTTATPNILTFTGNRTGAFDNAPDTGSIIPAGADAATVTYTGTAAGSISLAKTAANAGGTFTGVDADGTGYTVKLTGGPVGAELVSYTDAVGNVNIVTRNTGPTSRITVTTKANASDSIINLGTVRINGALNTLLAANANLNGVLSSSGAVTSITVGQVNSDILLGGLATTRTTIKAASVGGGRISTPGILASLMVGGTLFGEVDALSVGTIRATGTIFGAGPWNVTNGITSLSAASLNGVNITAGFFGTIAANGSVPLKISGDILFSNLTATGNDGTRALNGIRSLTAKGTVDGSRFNVAEGNVATFTVGRFINSQLYIDYTPGVDFATTGTFQAGNANFKLGSFKTTAVTLAVAHPYQYAFAGSEVAAELISSVRLTGLKTNNAGGSMGFKLALQTPVPSIQTTSVDAVGILVKKNIIPAVGAIANDFYFLDV